jgi:hypothetical protein
MKVEKKRESEEGCGLASNMQDTLDFYFKHFKFWTPHGRKKEPTSVAKFICNA